MKFRIVLRKHGSSGAENSTAQLLTKSQAEQLIDRFIKDGWLLQSRKEKLLLSMRMVVELEQYLRDSFGDVMADCNRCSKLVTKGRYCKTDGCMVALHYHCAQALFRVQDGADRTAPLNSCPNCRIQME